MRVTKEENAGSTTEQNSEEWEFGAERDGRWRELSEGQA